MIKRPSIVNTWAARKIASILLYFVFYLLPDFSLAADSCRLRISLLTCSPGEELYSTFGHSALRVADSSAGTDIVYNYGTFNFDEPGFYTKFIRGKLLYYLSTEEYPSFVKSYEWEKRNIIEQVLDLSCAEKENMMRLLKENLSGDNRYYKYDFLFDNCTTRLRDLLEKSAGGGVNFLPIVIEGARFRQLIHVYLDDNGKQWSKLGIDLLLGAKTDAVMSNREAMFLPDYLLKGFDSGHIAGRPVVLEKNKVIDLPMEYSGSDWLTSPLVIFSLLCLGILFISFSNSPHAKRFLAGFDGFLFFMTGFAGMVILFMWFGTDHVMCSNNYNLLWAWPTHAIAAFFLHRKRKWREWYFTLTTVALLLVLVLWRFLPQQMNPAFLPLVILLIIRSFPYARQPVYKVP